MYTFLHIMPSITVYLIEEHYDFVKKNKKNPSQIMKEIVEFYLQYKDSLKLEGKK